MLSEIGKIPSYVKWRNKKGRGGEEIIPYYTRKNTEKWEGINHLNHSLHTTEEQIMVDIKTDIEDELTKNYQKSKFKKMDKIIEELNPLLFSLIVKSVDHHITFLNGWCEMSGLNELTPIMNRDLKNLKGVKEFLRNTLDEKLRVSRESKSKLNSTTPV